jgi:RNA-directed DNA polymerase
MSMPVQLKFDVEPVPTVPEKAKQGTEAYAPEGWEWVEVSVWTERMLAALVNGVKGGKWYSLIAVEHTTAFGRET